MNIHAMVVDDSGIMRKMVMKALHETQLADFTFIEACDGADALTKFDPETTGMMFVDWNMPNMNGVDLVRRIRSSQKAHVPIVMITTEGTVEKVEEALDSAGADCFVVKPFTADILRKKLEPLFEKLAQDAAPKKGFFGRLANQFA